MIKGVLFDMDGILIDSEPFWQDAEIEIFGKLGLPLTREECIQTKGSRIEEVIHYWHARHPWEGRKPKDVATDIVNRTIEFIREKGTPLPGIYEAIQFFKDQGLRVGLATSSSASIIEAIFDRLKLHDHFEIIHSAEEETHGKPHPAVYMSAAKKLGVAPINCLAIEDSINGLISAKAARMKCLVVPDQSDASDPRFSIADHKLNSLSELNESVWKSIFN